MSDEARLTLDVSGALRKNNTIRAFPGAVKYVLTKWGGETLKHIKRGLAGPRLNTRSGHLKRNVGMNVGEGQLDLGTKVGNTGEVVYARILERGGAIRAKKAKYLTIPFPGVKGLARNFPDSFVIKSKSGALLIVQKDGKGRLKPLFLLKKEVKIPAFNWLSGSVADRRAELDRAVDEKNILNTAARMAERSSGKAEGGG